MKKFKMLVSASFAFMLFACPLPGTQSSPNPSSSSGLATISAKEQFIQAYECLTTDANVPKDIQALAQSQLAFFKTLGPEYFQTDPAKLEIYIKQAKTLCTSTSSQPATSPTAIPPANVTTPIATTPTGYNEFSCAGEGSLKSATGKSINVNFLNNTGKNIKIYWLDFNGKRVSYNGALKSGNTHPQQTYVTHPWLIADENDKCIKIFAPTETATTLEIK